MAQVGPARQPAKSGMVAADVELGRIRQAAQGDVVVREHAAHRVGREQPLLVQVRHEPLDVVAVARGRGVALKEPLDVASALRREELLQLFEFHAGENHHSDGALSPRRRPVSGTQGVTPESRVRRARRLR